VGLQVPFGALSSDPARALQEIERNTAELVRYVNATASLDDARLDALEADVSTLQTDLAAAEASIAGLFVSVLTLQDEMTAFTGATGALADYTPTSPGSYTTWDTITVTNPDPTANMNVYASVVGYAENLVVLATGVAFDAALQVSTDGGSSWTTVSNVFGSTTFLTDRCPLALTGARINVNPSGSIQLRARVQHTGTSGQMAFKGGTGTIICTRT
jgi:hypothetical protein